MKNSILLLLIISLFSCGKKQSAKVGLNTDFFEFHNNYWVNLHHFLYQKADSSQLKKLEEDGLNFIEIGESDAFMKLSSSEREIFNSATEYYRDSLIDKDLRRDLNDLRIWLSEQEEFKRITDNSFGMHFKEIINKVSPIYAKYFWNLHKNHNLSILSEHIEDIDEIEEIVIHDMERLSLNEWPDSPRVRVDLTAYANWAGAYTSSQPRMNIVLSTTDPSKVTSTFVETVLHEGSHLLYLFGESPIRDKLYYTSEEMKVEFPSNLWHASMFYLCGRATQDALSKLSINHEMVMDANNIFANYNTPEFRDINEKYYNGKIDSDSMVINLLNEVIDKSH